MCLAFALLALLAGRAIAQDAGGTPLTVRVVSTAGDAEAGATVYAATPGITVATCTLQNQCGTAVGETDGAGKVAYTPLGSGPLVLCANVPTPNLYRYVGCTDPFTTSAGSTVTILTQAIPPSPFRDTQAGSGAITLLVQDENGQPLPNTPVLLGLARMSFGEYSTGADGSLTFENVSAIDAPCAYVFSFQTEQFTQSGCLGLIGVAPWGSASATLRLSAGGGATVQMQLGAVVFTVVDPSGRPMPVL